MIHAALLLLALLAPPTPALTMPAEVVRVVDGDTLVVEVRLQLHVRLLDCWCPESRTTDAREKAKGLAAKAFAAQTIAEQGRDVMLTVPLTGDLSDSLTLGRVLGRVWLNDGRELSEAMRAKGHARKEKEAK